MKPKTHFIALLMLAALFASCQSTRVQKGERSNALITAAKDNNVAEVRRLIAAGADVNAEDNYGITALMMATKEDTAKVLIEAGANVNAKSNAGWTALMQAAEDDSPDVARLLIAAGADVNATDNRGMTALMYATEYEYDSDDVAELLLAAGAYINAKDNRGKTALMYATFNGATKIAELLEAAGAR